MLRFLQRIPYPPLVIAALLLGLAPFVPEPHLVEKLRLLLHGRLQRPLDVFDLLLHGTPPALLLIKLVLGRRSGR